MMGPLHRFRDSEHLDRLLAEARASGIKVRFDKKRASPGGFWFRRGLGLIYGGVGFGGCETVIYFGFGHPFNPLLWLADRSLLKCIEHVFVSNGAALVDLNSIAEPCASPNGGPAMPLGNSEATEGPPSVS
jgi:hypothetical protein